MENKNVYVIVEKGKQLGVRYNGKTYMHKKNEPYEKLFQIIEKENPGFFDELIKNGYEQKTLKELEKLEKTYAVKNLKVYDNNINSKQKKTKKFNTAQKLALGFAGLCLLGLAGLGISKYQKDKKQTDPTSYTQKSNYAQLTKEDVKKMSFKELCAYLKNGKQRETFELLDDVQSNFNNKLAPKIKVEKDEENQLYLKAEELIALHIIANSDTYHNSILVSIYDDLLNAEKISSDYVQASRVMWSYYSRAKEPSGIDKLFSDEKNQKLVKTFEQLIIAYNKAEDKNKKELGKEIVELFKSLTDISKIDNALENNKEAVSYILTVGLPFAYSNSIINEEEYNHLIDQNETITCDELYKQVEIMTSEAQNTALENNLVLLEIPRALNEKNIKVTSRDIKVEFNRTKNYYDEHKISNNTSSNTTYSNTVVEQITRQEAVEIFGEELVKEKEEQAEEVVENNNIQAENDAKDYANGYNTGYEQAYLTAAKEGKQISSVTSGNVKYQEGYAKGVVAGYNDGMIEYRAKEEAIENNNTDNGTIVDKPLLPEVLENEETVPDKTDEEELLPPTNNEESSTDTSIIEKPLDKEEPQEGEIATDDFGNTLEPEKVRARA